MGSLYERISKCVYVPWWGVPRKILSHNSVYVWGCAHKCKFLGKPKESVKCLRAEVASGCELTHMDAGKLSSYARRVCTLSLGHNNNSSSSSKTITNQLHDEPGLLLTDGDCAISCSFREALDLNTEQALVCTASGGPQQ